MVATRSRGVDISSTLNKTKKRSAAHSSQTKTTSKKAKKEKDGKLEIGDDGELGLKTDDDPSMDSKNDAEGYEQKSHPGKATDEEEVDRSKDNKEAVGGTSGEFDPIASDKEDEEQDVKRSGRGETTQQVRFSQRSMTWILEQA